MMISHLQTGISFLNCLELPISPNPGFPSHHAILESIWGISILEAKVDAGAIVGAQGPLERIMNPIYGRKVVLDTFRLSSYVQEQSSGGGALVQQHGVKSSIEKKVIRPAKKVKTSDGTNSKITSVFNKST